MTTAMMIALDAMGGDNAPEAVIEGAALASRQHPNVHFLLFGDSETLGPLVAAHPNLAQRSDVRHAAQVVGPEDKPSHALRRATQSSMRLAIDSKVVPAAVDLKG